MKYLHYVLLPICCLMLAGCLESFFELAPSSRLPRWFPNTQGIMRQDVTVTLEYYTGDEVKAILRKYGKPLSVVTGTDRTHPQTLMKTNSYPHYSIITINGVTEVIEHRAMEPVFYVSDDPALTSNIGR